MRKSAGYVPAPLATAVSWRPPLRRTFSPPDSTTAIVPASKDDVFAAVRAALQASMSMFSFRGFIEPLSCVALGAGDGGAVLQLGAPTAFLRDWVRDHYANDIATSATSVLSMPVRVEVIVADADSPAPVSLVPKTNKERGPAQHEEADGYAIVLRAPSRSHGSSSSSSGSVPLPRLHPRFTLDNFVVGETSRLAAAAAAGVAAKPGALYTPLCLFGQNGLGKTHLLHAVGHDILQRHPHLRVVLTTTEQWVNEYVRDIADKKFEQFRRRWREQIDVLLIDDIQFLAGKTASQEEFFHTFNALFEAHKQVVFTSDRHPLEISGLDERLKSRLQWGLTVDVRAPDIAARRAILDKRSFENGTLLPSDVADFLATHVTHNVRELESALVRLEAFSQITQQPITLAVAREQLRPILQARSEVGPDRVIDVVAAYYGLRSKDITGPTRQRQVTRARQVAMWLVRKHLQMSLPEMGRAFGDRDHSTVLTSVRKIEGLRSTDVGVESVLSRLERSLFGDRP
jgi:chromosomal replication initiator protein